MKRDDPTPAGDATSLLRLMGQFLDATGDSSAYENEDFIAWLEREIQGRVVLGGGDEDAFAVAQAVSQTVSRAQMRIRAARAGDALPVRPFRSRAATVQGDAKQVARVAAKSGCAPWVESLAVAAGSGREIWDEPCEQWVELPAGTGAGAHIALTVAGDSMTPCLHSGDVILVNTRQPLTRDCIVVARRADNGYVVKYVTRCGRSTLELSSFNRNYAPFTIGRSPGAIIGVVVARLAREVAVP